VPYNGPVASVLGQILAATPRPPRELQPALDCELEAICLQAISKVTHQRFLSALAFADSLEVWAQSNDRNGPRVVPVSSAVALHDQNKNEVPIRTLSTHNQVAPFRDAADATSRPAADVYRQMQLRVRMKQLLEQHRIVAGYCKRRGPITIGLMNGLAGYCGTQLALDNGVIPVWEAHRVTTTGFLTSVVVSATMIASYWCVRVVLQRKQQMTLAELVRGLLIEFPNESQTYGGAAALLEMQFVEEIVRDKEGRSFPQSVQAKG